MNDSFELIYNDLNLEGKETLTDAQLLEIISDRVAWFLENDKDLLLSYLYRLDVEESKIDRALSPMDVDPLNIAIGKLILTRQKQRLISKKTYNVSPIEGWEF